MARNRFAPPVGDLTIPAFVDLYVTAAFTDTFDRLPNTLDFTYWRREMPGLVARGVEINHPNYAWDRLIGWQAGPQDAARYGPYATPPNTGPAAGWLTPFVDSDAQVAPAPPVARDVLTDLLPSLERIEHGLMGLAAAVFALNARLDDVKRNGVRVHL